MIEFGEIPNTPGWRYQMIDVAREGRSVFNTKEVGGRVLFEYHVYASEADRLAAVSPVLMVNHRAQIRERHLRQVRMPDGARRHTSGLLVYPDGTPDKLTDTEFVKGLEFYDYTSMPKLELSGDRASLVPDWDAGGRKLAPYVFETYFGVDEALDNQWQRETFAETEDDQILELLYRWVGDAYAKGLHLRKTDWRGTVQNLAITASGDDVTIRNDGTSWSATSSGASQKINSHSTSNVTRQNIGLRYLATGIGQGDTIDSIAITANVDNTFRDDFSGDVYGEDVDDAAAFSDTGSRHPIRTSGLTLTTTNVAVYSTGTGTGDVTTGWPDITSVLQEIVDRGGFTSSSDMVICWLGKTSGADNLDGTMQSYDGSTSLTVRMDVTHTAAAGGGLLLHANRRFY